MKIYLATWLFDKTLGISMTKKKGSQRLVSYHFLREQGISKDNLLEYCKTGKYNPNKK